MINSFEGTWRGWMFGSKLKGLRGWLSLYLPFERRVAPDAVELEMDSEEGLADDLPPLLTPETPLARYSMGGETVEFTALDYYFWLPELPFAEATSLPAASLGRALRNDAFYRAGLARGLAADSVVQGEILKAQRNELTRRMRQQMADQPPADIPEAELRRAYDTNPISKKKQWKADFWVLSFADKKEAEAVHDQLVDNLSDAALMDSYVRYEQQLLEETPEWAPVVRAAPLRELNLANRSDGVWALVYVEQRTAMSLDYESAREALRKEILPRYNEYQLIKQLRQEASIQTDTLLFEQIMYLE